MKLLLEEDIDALIVIYIRPIPELLEPMIQAIRQVAPEFRKKGIPVMLSLLGADPKYKLIGSPEEGYIPEYHFFPETAFSLAKRMNTMNTQGNRGKIPKFEEINKRPLKPLLKQRWKEAVLHRPGWIPDEIANLFDV